ncbi:hypothetical protein, partial [Brevundimonas sp.]|uniref:hypothetical protein n=1 Tax=Brevundimonas sp. TaxID=1871086 RepID=UPI0025C64528
RFQTGAAEAAPAPIRVLKAFQFNILGKGRPPEAETTPQGGFGAAAPFGPASSASILIRLPHIFRNSFTL